MTPYKKTPQARTDVWLEVHMNQSTKLTQKEAEDLLNMLKKSLIKQLDFPSMGDSIEFDIVGTEKKHLFTSKIYRGKINRKKYEIGARIKKNGIMLLELHINPGKIHINPDGTKIKGSHWHIYSEKYGRRQAFPADKLDSEQFVDNTILFLQKFNVVEIPSINFQLELIT